MTRSARLVLIASLAAALAACATPITVTERDTAPPIPVTCASQCTESCLPAVWPKWKGDPNEPTTWDRVYPDVAQPIVDIAKACDVARNACVMCIRRVERTGAICGATMPCVREPSDGQ